jgi:hypothetical protein
MSLKIGEWKLNENGLESTLIIDKLNADTGEISGMVAGEKFTGLWDETSRTISFAVYLSGGTVPPPGSGQIIFGQFFKGFLFSTPRNPTPGQDVLWTLTGTLQVTDLPPAQNLGGNARRNVFGWFAQITEVA